MGKIQFQYIQRIRNSSEIKNTQITRKAFRRNSFGIRNIFLDTAHFKTLAYI